MAVLRAASLSTETGTGCLSASRPVRSSNSSQNRTGNWIPLRRVHTELLLHVEHKPQDGFLDAMAATSLSTVSRKGQTRSRQPRQHACHVQKNPGSRERPRAVGAGLASCWPILRGQNAGPKSPTGGPGMGAWMAGRIGPSGRFSPLCPLRLKVVLCHLLAEGLAVDSEDPGGLGLVASRVGQDVANVVRFHLGQGPVDACGAEG